MTIHALPCPICTADSYFFDRYPDFFGALVSLHKCIGCGHGFHDRHYTPDQFEAIYKADYAAEYISEEKELYKKRQLQYALDVEHLLAQRAFGVVKVLDYGCSSGDYLDAMPAHWIKSGYEVNPFHVQHVRRHKPHIAMQSEIAAIEGPFDLITLRGVIEHIPDHRDLIAFLQRQVAPGGAVFITATPDFSSTCAALYKKRWNQITCPEHIHQFSAASLSLLLAGAGLALQSLDHPYLGTPYADAEADMRSFLANCRLAIDDPAAMQTRHAFPGNMMSAFYQKVPLRPAPA